MDSIINIGKDSGFKNIDDVEFIHDSVVVKRSKVHGRGVFATKDILAGQLVERFPLLPLLFRVRYQGDPQLLMSTLVHTTCPCEECKNHGWQMYQQGGCGMFYNHQDNQNANIKANWEMYYVEIEAIKTIKEGEEVYIHYGHNYPWEISGLNKVTIESSSPNEDN